jgi:hypothetical protein
MSKGDMNKESLNNLVPFPFIAQQTGTVDYKIKCPINDILEFAVKQHIPAITAMGMLYVEASKIFPTFSVKPDMVLDFDQDIPAFQNWFTQVLNNVPREMKSLFFKQEVDYRQREEDRDGNDDEDDTYSICVLGSESYDKELDWIEETQSLTNQNFQSKTLDNFFKFKESLIDFNNFDQSLRQTLFLEHTLLYGYGALLLAESCRRIGSSNLRKRHIVYGIFLDNELISHQSLELTALLIKR